MKPTLFYSTLLCAVLFVASCSSSGNDAEKRLANEILNDKSLFVVDSMARSIIRNGLNAGSTYSQIWARDMNTFIETAVDEGDKATLRGAILLFFALQQPNGEMIDGYVAKGEFTWYDDTPYYSEAAPGHVAFKNTVETDQESSLIQLIGKYIRKTGDKALLKETVAGFTVEQRIDQMIDFLMKERWSEKYGMLYGAMTADWGDVQPNDDFGCDFNDLSYPAIDVYDNAMFMIALDYLVEMNPESQQVDKWKALRGDIAHNVRKYLWDSERNKFIPHIYLDKSPEFGDFDENSIHFHGGTAVAIEAGLLSREEIVRVNNQMLENVRLSGMPTIGLTLYPPYPQGLFHGNMGNPYIYQNGGDWTWFGGRMIQQLVKNDMPEQAYVELRPMLDRVIKNNGFYEWYGQGGVPSGSGHFKGSAGVLAKSIELLKTWAEEHK